MLTIVCLVLALGLPAFAVRGYVKLRVRKIISADDWIMLAAAVLWFGYVACQVAACANGFGAHTADLPEDAYYYLVGTSHNGDVVEALRFWYTCTLFHVFTTCFVLLSAGLTVAQHITSTPLRRLIAAALALCALISIAHFFLLTFQCTPPSAFWSRNRTDTSQHCSSTCTTIAWRAFTATTTAITLLLSAFPATALLSPGTPWRKRAAIAIPTTFAFAAATTSALQTTQVSSLSNSADLTFTAADFAIYALLAPSLGLVAASLATLGPWLKELGWDTEAGAEVAWRRERGGRGRGRRRQVGVVRGLDGDDVEAVLEEAVRQGMERLEGRGGGGG